MSSTTNEIGGSNSTGQSQAWKLTSLSSLFRCWQDTRTGHKVCKIYLNFQCQQKRGWDWAIRNGERGQSSIPIDHSYTQWNKSESVLFLHRFKHANAHPMHSVWSVLGLVERVGSLPKFSLGHDHWAARLRTRTAAQNYGRGLAETRRSLLLLVGSLRNKRKHTMVLCLSFGKSFNPVCGRKDF